MKKRSRSKTPLCSRLWFWVLVFIFAILLNAPLPDHIRSRILNALPGVLLLVAFFLYYFVIQPTQEKRARLNRIYGFISALALSPDAVGLYFNEVYSMAAAESRRLDKLKSPPPLGSDPLYGANDYEFSLLIVLAYAQRNDLPRLADYVSDLLPAARTLDFYHRSAPFEP